MLGKWKELQIGSGGENPQSSENVRELPQYKTIVKSVLRKQILNLIEELCSESGEDIMVLSANVSEGTLSTVGSQKVEGFVDNDMARQFYEYCQSCSIGSHFEKQAVGVKRPAPASYTRKPQAKSIKLDTTTSSKSHCIQSFGTDSTSDSSSSLGVMTSSVTSLPVSNDLANFTTAFTAADNSINQTQNISEQANQQKLNLVTKLGMNPQEKYKIPAHSTSRIKHQTDVADDSSNESSQQRHQLDSENSSESVKTSSSDQITTSKDNENDNTSMNLVTRVKLEPDIDTSEYGGSNMEASMDACDMDESFLGQHMGPDSITPSEDLASIVAPHSIGAAVPAASVKYMSGMSERNENDSGPKRFKATMGDEINQLKSHAGVVEINTEKLTKWAVKLVKDWMTEVKYGHSSFEWLPAPELGLLLEQFYPALQTKEGKSYSKQTLRGIRAALNRHLTAQPISRKINIMKDEEFASANDVLKGLIQRLQIDGRQVVRKDIMDGPDIRKLYASGLLDDGDPVTLQNKVLYDIISLYGLYGRHCLRSLKKSSFSIHLDANGKKYVKLVYMKPYLNTNGIEKHVEITNNAVMYEMGGQLCPVKSFEKYLSKLNPMTEDFFQRPSMHMFQCSKTWYSALPVGHNTLCTFMSRLSHQARLSRRYTNNSIPPRHQIITVKNEMS